MKKQILFTILFFILIICVGAFILISNAFNSGGEEEKEKLINKAEEEIYYLEDKLISMMNKLNSISFSNYVLSEEKQSSSEKSSESSQTDNSSSSGGGSDSGSGSSGGESSSKKNSSASSESSTDTETKKSESSDDNSKYELKSSGILLNSNQQTDWNYIKSNIEIIHSSLSTIIIDLHQLEVNNDDILKFSNILDKVTLSIKQEDKISTINNLASLYDLLPIYIEQISQDNKIINSFYTKACVLNTYALIEQNNKEEMKIQIANGIEYFSNIMNQIHNNNDNNQEENRVGEIYILLNELNNSIDLNDKEIYYIKYRNLMEKLINL